MFKTRTNKFLGLLTILMVFYGLAFIQKNNVPYEYKPEKTFSNFEEYYQYKVAASKKAGIADFNTEKYTQYKEQTPLAILYIHGFGASRAEGEDVTDHIGKTYKYNTYYVRLPGHHEGPEAHAKATYDQYLSECEQAFHMLKQKGKKILLVATSTGGLIATYLASKYQADVHAVILAAPLWDFGNKTVHTLAYPGMVTILKIIYGEYRDSGWKSDPEKRKAAGYEERWMIKQKNVAVENLRLLHRFIVKPETFKSVTAPVLTFYYFADSERRDTTVDIDAILKYSPMLGADTPGAGKKNKLVPIADGNHVLFSSFVRTDKDKMKKEIDQFLKSL